MPRGRAQHMTHRPSLLSLSYLGHHAAVQQGADEADTVDEAVGQANRGADLVHQRAEPPHRRVHPCGVDGIGGHSHRTRTQAAEEGEEEIEPAAARMTRKEREAVVLQISG